MCTVADGTTWYLAATISDNTTTTINLSISDANLAAAAAAPGYNTTGSRPLFPRSAHIFAENILGFSANGTPITTFTATNTSSQVRFGFYFTNTSSALGDRYQTNVYLEGGTYTFEIYGIKTTTCGIFDLYVDGVLISAGNDWYSASTVYDQVLDITNVSVIGNGYHLIEMVISGTSHTSYRLPITYISMWKATY
jgi:hypothetical protein